MRAKDQVLSMDEVNNFIIDIASAAEQQNNILVVKKLKDLIPEFLSQNSIYEELDKEVKIST